MIGARLGPVLIILLVAACAADGLSGSTGRGDASARDGGATGPSCRGDADCEAGQRCSVTGACIGEGICLADGDCAGGERCGAGSRLCLAPGSCAANGDCASGEACDLDTGTCSMEGCGASEFVLTRLPPNMMILLDRSGSMDGTIGGRTRWDIAKDAVRGVTTMFDAEIRFGLATYSSCLSGGCSAGSIVVPIAGSNAAAINGFLEPLVGRGSRRGTPPEYLCDSGDPETSTGRSLFALVGEASLLDPMRGNAVLLMTDGGESGECTGGGMNGPAGAAALLAQDPSVRTFVVGFTTDAPAAAMNAIAMAGGTAMYHPAEDLTSLSAALTTIASSVATCDYVLDSAPPDPSMLYVYFDDDPAGVPAGAADGWIYDAATMTLRFTGAPCDEIRSGAVMDIDVVFGCPGPVLE